MKTHLKTAFISVAILFAASCARNPRNITSIPGAAPAARGSEAFFGAPFKAKPASSVYDELFPGPTSDELWVISRLEPERRDSRGEEPGSGALVAEVEGQPKPLPLKHTDVRASISGYIASVDVRQQFENPYAEKIEAVYVFPLPENAAVNEFIMKIGTRRIRGIVRERQEAERIYNDAKTQGYTASLLTQERPNIFKQSVANIEPGKEIDISIRYYNTLSYSDGWYEFVFPMVVGPRFNPPGSFGGIGAVPASGLARSGQGVDLHYLPPGTRSGQDIGVRLEVNAGVTIENYECRSHSVKVQQGGPGELAVELEPADSLPNKDFVFRYRVAGNSIKTSVVRHEDHRGGFFTLMLYPPAALENLERSPLELVFVLDCSGSMSGEPLKQAKSGIRWALRHMNPEDTFQLINFSIDARQFGRTPLPATPENLRRALVYLESLTSEGGTMMIEGIKAALDFPDDPSRLRFVCLLTDGYIGNEGEILREIDARLGASRIFSFGVGSSVNRYLLDSMAKTGRGAVAYLGLKDDGAAVMERFFERISHPALTDVAIDWKGLKVTDVYPRDLPDLFVGRPVIITGRYQPRIAEASVIEVTGWAGGNRVRVPVPLAGRGVLASTPALPSIWARLKIADLLNNAHETTSSWTAARVRQTALDYQLLSPFTAFLALDASRRTAGDSGVTVPVAVPVPEGVRYDTTVE